MPLYKFRAYNNESGHEEVGKVEALDENQALETLASKSYQVISLELTTQGKSWTNLEFLNRINAKDLVVFSRQFSVMVSSSVPVVETLKILSQQLPKPKLRRVVGEIADEVDGGDRLSDSLAKRPGIFSNFFVSVIKSGEQSGKLDETLNYIADQMERDFEMNSKIKGAMIYPIFVVILMVSMGFLVMIFIVPKLTEILIETGGELPIATRILIGTSDFLVAFWWAVIAGLIGLIIAFRLYFKTSLGRLNIHYLILKVPIFGNLLQMIYLVRFTRSMSTLIAGGVNISESLAVAGEVTNNAYYQKIVEKTMIEVQSGNSISLVFTKTPEIPTMVSQMMMVGEKTGKLDLSFEKITSFYNREITNMLGNLMSLIEPILMVVMGLGVGIMVAAILLPMYNVASQL